MEHSEAAEIRRRALQIANKSNDVIVSRFLDRLYKEKSWEDADFTGARFLPITPGIGIHPRFYRDPYDPARGLHQAFESAGLKGSHFLPTEKLEEIINEHGGPGMVLTCDDKGTNWWTDTHAVINNIDNQIKDLCRQYGSDAISLFADDIIQSVKEVIAPPDEVAPKYRDYLIEQVERSDLLQTRKDAFIELLNGETRRSKLQALAVDIDSALQERRLLDDFKRRYQDQDE